MKDDTILKLLLTKRVHNIRIPLFVLMLCALIIGCMESSTLWIIVSAILLDKIKKIKLKID